MSGDSGSGFVWGCRDAAVGWCSLDLDSFHGIRASGSGVMEGRQAAGFSTWEHVDADVQVCRQPGKIRVILLKQEWEKRLAEWWDDRRWRLQGCRLLHVMATPLLVLLFYERQMIDVKTQDRLSDIGSKARRRQLVATRNMYTRHWSHTHIRCSSPVRNVSTLNVRI